MSWGVGDLLGAAVTSRLPGWVAESQQALVHSTTQVVRKRLPRWRLLIGVWVAALAIAGSSGARGGRGRLLERSAARGAGFHRSRPPRDVGVAGGVTELEPSSGTPLSPSICRSRRVRTPCDLCRIRSREFATSCRSFRTHVSWPDRTLTGPPKSTVAHSGQEIGAHTEPRPRHRRQVGIEPAADIAGRQAAASECGVRSHVCFHHSPTAGHPPSAVFTWPEINRCLPDTTYDNTCLLAGSPLCPGDWSQTRRSHGVSAAAASVRMLRGSPNIQSGDPARKNRTALTRRPSNRGPSFSVGRPERTGITEVADPR